MIRLFRKIRQQLLSEDKYPVYLLYAAGEIALVVIGILFALQIDNWNEDRKLREEASGFQETLRADLVKDTILIASQLDILVKDTVQLYGFVRRMSGEHVTLDTLVRIARYEYNPWIYTNISFNRNTLTSLQSTGKLGILEPWLQNDLLELNAMHQAYRNDTESDVRSFLDQLNVYNTKYPFPDYGHIDPDSRLSEVIWNEVKFRELAIDLNSIVALKYVSDLPCIAHLNRIQKKSKEILAKLPGDPEK